MRSDPLANDARDREYAPHASTVGIRTPRSHTLEFENRTSPAATHRFHWDHGPMCGPGGVAHRREAKHATRASITDRPAF